MIATAATRSSGPTSRRIVVAGRAMSKPPPGQPVSRRARVWAVTLEEPTAQTSPVAALTPLSRWSLPPTLGLTTTDQALPFQCSVRVRSIGMAPLRSCRVPTAQTSVADLAATPDRVSLDAGLGLVTIDQAVPFQCSTRVFGSGVVRAVVMV